MWLRQLEYSKFSNHLPSEMQISAAWKKKNSDLYLLFIHDVEEVRREFDENRREPPLRNDEPRWAGSALWATALAQNVEHSWSLLQAATCCL